MATPKTSKCMGKPQSSTLGLRVSRTTMRTGTKKIRSNVSVFGRFIRAYGKKAAIYAQKPAGTHYRLGLGGRQRVKVKRDANWRSSGTPLLHTTSPIRMPFAAPRTPGYSDNGPCAQQRRAKTSPFKCTAEATATDGR